MFEEFLAHIPFHLGSHDMSLTADIIFAEALDDIHHKESDRDPRKRLQESEQYFLYIGKVFFKSLIPDFLVKNIHLC